MFFSPLVLVMMLVCIASLGALFVVVQIGVIGYAFERVGVPSSSLFSLLLLSWFGSWVNLPIARLRHHEPLSEAMVVQFFGQRYIVPRLRRPRETVVAVNLGGAVVPALLSLYLLSQALAPLRVIMATAVVTAVTHWFARPLRGVGIAIPLFIPPLSAAVIALLLVPQQAPLTAYIAGTMGTLLGADLLNLHKVSGLGAPVVSIGGAGTFDGVFLTGIIAVLLA
jgi:uncharacterized membrane protein